MKTLLVDTKPRQAYLRAATALMQLLVAAAILLAAPSANAQTTAERILPPAPQAYSSEVERFIEIQQGKIALVNVNVIDGTGGPAKPHRTVLIDGPLVLALLEAAEPVPDGYNIIDASGKSVIPGLIGMHNHIYYVARPNLQDNGASDPDFVAPEMSFSSPKLYLAAGVTTIRTAGSVEPYTDLNLKRLIDNGERVGPNMDVTAPYFEGSPSPYIMMEHLSSPEAVRSKAEYWASVGATSFKVYTNLDRAGLAALLEVAHANNIKVTGHLCSITYPEAIAAGIDNIEHGFFANTQLDPDKVPDACSASQGQQTLDAMVPGSPEAEALIALLVENEVAITSTLPVFSYSSAKYEGPVPNALNALTPQARKDLEVFANLFAGLPEQYRTQSQARWHNALALEKAFFEAGGLLIGGSDPTGAGQVLPGFGDLLEVELLVEAGLSTSQAIRVATLNGAIFLGLDDKIGSISPGKRADLVLIDGDPMTNISDLRNAVTIFKNGVGYSPHKLLEAVEGNYGRF